MAQGKRIAKNKSCMNCVFVDFKRYNIYVVTLCKAHQRELMFISQAEKYTCEMFKGVANCESIAERIRNSINDN